MGEPNDLGLPYREPAVAPQGRCTRYGTCGDGSPWRCWRPQGHNGPHESNDDELRAARQQMRVREKAWELVLRGRSMDAAIETAQAFWGKSLSEFGKEVK